MAQFYDSPHRNTEIEAVGPSLRFYLFIFFMFNPLYSNYIATNLHLKYIRFPGKDK
jgi:hypothetical protein